MFLLECDKCHLAGKAEAPASTAKLPRGWVLIFRWCWGSVSSRPPAADRSCVLRRMSVDVHARLSPLSRLGSGTGKGPHEVRVDIALTHLWCEGGRHARWTWHQKAPFPRATSHRQCTQGLLHTMSQSWTPSDTQRLISIHHKLIKLKLVIFQEKHT